ncbi:hypothetical protein J2X65_002026 [Ancylobacter sp. 3268]|uniref:hypothetical protein n=1 Tax=Ancylobacter sp. 3268 TaxID=2817752 RepID=UPI002854FE34|nr:hypothetical protein [Ancylobacter sp. 3268]MDR6952667.1 hypothetical protein [Ancylobacter sp. 3268]
MERCTQIVTHSKIKVEEHGRKAIFENSNGDMYHVSIVDNCLITDGSRADRLVRKVGDSSVIVELKGKDVDHGIKQLMATVEHPNIRSMLESKIGFLLVCRRYPKFDYYVAKAKTEAAKKYKAGFHVVCDQRQVKIEEVVKINGSV